MLNGGDKGVEGVETNIKKHDVTDERR